VNSGAGPAAFPLDDCAFRTFQKAGSRSLALTLDSSAFDNENLERISSRRQKLSPLLRTGARAGYMSGGTGNVVILRLLLHIRFLATL
jgi:hypothetical protein